MIRKGDILIRTKCGLRYKVLLVGVSNILLEPQDGSRNFILDTSTIEQCLENNVLHMELNFSREYIVKHIMV